MRFFEDTGQWGIVCAAQGQLTAVWWDGPYFHPKEFQVGEINADLVESLRMAKPDNMQPKCNAPAALLSAPTLLPSVRKCVSTSESSVSYKDKPTFLSPGKTSLANAVL